VPEIGWRLGPNGREVFPLAADEPGGPIGRGSTPDWVASHQERIAAHLERYFRSVNDASVFQGQHFEWFQHRSSAVAFTESDLLAIGALSVSLPAQSARRLVEDTDGKFGQLLQGCHEVVEHAGADIDLTTCPPAWLEDILSPFNALYDGLRSLYGSGPVITSKLMACKFPALIPIRDHLVEVLLGMERSDAWWMPIRRLLLTGTPSVDSILRGIDGGAVFGHVCVTRRLDVALWMEARARDLGRRD